MRTQVQSKSRLNSVKEDKSTSKNKKKSKNKKSKLKVELGTEALPLMKTKKPASKT